MGKYLSFANQCIQKFKPVIEEKTGVKLEDVIGKEASEYYKRDEDYSPDISMFVDMGCDNSIFVNEKRYEEMGDRSLYKIPRGVAHELAHLAHRKLIKKVRETNPKADISRSVKRYKKSESFREGFAEYMSLTYLNDAYDYETYREVWKDMMRNAGYDNFLPRGKPYERGYKFFRKVLSVIGKDKVFEVARSPPLNELEVRMPLLYLLRRYPAQGIRNIPKFFTKAIRTKLLKKIYGYAPSDY